MATPYIRFYGGTRGIGGNQILVVASNGKGVLLDFGLDFGITKQYFDDFLKIRDKQALIDATSVGLIPWPSGDLKGLYREDLENFNLEFIEEAYRAHQAKTGDTEPLKIKDTPIVSEVLVSHAHIDHIGFIKFLHPSIRVICSEISKKIMEHMDELGGASSSFKDIVSYGPIGQMKPDEKIKPGESLRLSPKSPEYQRKGREIVGKPFETSFLVAEGGLKVQIFETDHSIPGSCGFLIEDVETSKKLVYTGDVRFHGPNGVKSTEFIQKIAKKKPDVLITEGTRLTADSTEEGEDVQLDGRENEQPDEKAVFDHIDEFIQNVKATDPNKLILFNCSPRDLWRVGTFFHAAEKNKRQLVVDVKMFGLIQALDPTGIIFGMDLNKLKVYLPRKEWGLYEYDDYDNSAAIRKVFQVPLSERIAIVEALNLEKESEWKEIQKQKENAYNALIKDWVALGSPKPKPKKTSASKFTPLDVESMKGRHIFWEDPPFKVVAREIHDHQGDYLLYMTPYTMNELFDIQPDPGAYYILSTSGPFDEEGQIDDKRRKNWLRLFGIPEDDTHHGHFHCSGHMAESQVFATIEQVSPKQVFLVHSLGKKAFESNVKPPIKPIIPKVGQKYQW